jgi:protein TonB
MSVTSREDPRSDSDRLALTLFLAIALHTLIILGVSFTPGDRNDRPPDLPTLDITVVQKRTPSPDEADYLAQADQDGAGNVTEKVRPRQATPEPAPAVPASPMEPEPERVVTQPEARQQISENRSAAPNTEIRNLTAAQLINRSIEMVTLEEQLDQSPEVYSRQPRQVFISARTREFKYANYLNDWVNKVERVGNLNYPEQARRQGISGSLLLDVALNADGTVRDITVLRPSGHAMIDEAAIRIVNLAAPFAPLPNDIRKEADVLHITRTWEFSSNNTLRSK